MRICVLFNDDTALVHGAAEDAIAVQAVADSARAIAAALNERGHAAHALGIAPDPRRAASQVAQLRTELAFNLVEGIGGDPRKDQAFAWLLELHGIAYTGAGPRALGLCLEKPVTRALLASAGLPVPRGAVFESGAFEAGAFESHSGSHGSTAADLRFPLIVKPAREDASHGISLESVVRDEAALRARVQYVIERYAQPAVVEEYIEAREINVAMLASNRGLEILPLSEIDYSGFEAHEPHIVTYAGKWIEGSRDWNLTQVIAARELAPPQRAKIESVARRTFDLLDLRDYGRVDLRLDVRGEPFVIDVNPNPDISPGAGFLLAAERAGLSYADVVVRIAESAARRAHQPA
jgi:D-alanine-D-alanine ligase